MTTNLDRFKDDMAKLKALGAKMQMDLALRHLSDTGELDKKYAETAKKVKAAFETNYQRWFTEACVVLKQLLPDRLGEFVELYHGNGKRKTIDSMTYHIQDWLNGIRAGDNLYGKKRYDDFAIVSMRFKTQSEILVSVETRFESSLFDMAQLVRADLFDSELDAARELSGNGFLRGAGAVAGVVIEKHLAQVCTNHSVTCRKKHPTIADLNALLKNAGILDVPGWRKIQRLGDIRNLCDHNKQREPTNDEVNELIDGADALCKTLF